MALPFDTTLVLNIVKVMMLAGSAELFMLAVAPPKRFTAEKESVYRGQPFEFLVHHLANLGSFLVSASALCHSVLILYFDEEMLAKPITGWICPSTPSSIQPLTRLSPIFITSVLLTGIGTLIRLWAYKALGPLFTFEVVIKNDHRLVTSGPYQYVRHPAYTGLALLLLGTHLIHLGEGGYVSYCDIDATPFAIFVNIWRVGTVFTMLSLCRRCGVEDAQLQERFAAEWDGYRRAVPYALVPFVY